jgi:hypothetical protein
MKQRITLYAEDGMILTDGEHYGTIIHLAVGSDAEKYHEIPCEEYERIIKEREENQST